MARAFKQGLDYFPLDVDLDDKFALIKAKFGMEGFGTIISLFQKIYKVGYYYRWTEKEQLLFSTSVNVDINTINAIIKAAAAWELFSETLLNDYNILTSHGIQKRYFGAISRREKITIYKELLLIDVSDCKNSIIVNINPQNADICTQSTVQYSTLNPPTPLLGGISQNSENQTSEQPEKPERRPKEKPKPEPGERYVTKKGRNLTGDGLRKFLEFCRVFDYPKGKAAAADAWCKIKNLDEIYPKIIAGARAEAKRRPEIEAKGQTPQMMQGWISGRRWEDFTEPIAAAKKPEEKKPPPEICKNCGKERFIFNLESGLCRECYTGKKTDF